VKPNVAAISSDEPSLPELGERNATRGKRGQHQWRRSPGGPSPRKEKKRILSGGAVGSRYAASETDGQMRCAKNKREGAQKKKGRRFRRKVTPSCYKEG